MNKLHEVHKQVVGRMLPLRDSYRAIWDETKDHSSEALRFANCVMIFAILPLFWLACYLLEYYISYRKAVKTNPKEKQDGKSRQETKRPEDFPHSSSGSTPEGASNQAGS
ncbi:hypothetical protein D3C78_1156260 [compost metagenome]